MCIERTDTFASYPNILNQSAEYRLLWHYICFRANQKGLFWRSYQTIADEVGLTRRSVYRLMQQMQEDGLLLKMAETKHKTNLFYVRKSSEVPVDNFSTRDRCVPTIGTGVSLSLGTGVSPKRNIKTFKEKRAFLKNSDSQKTEDVGSVELKKSITLLKTKVG